MYVPINPGCQGAYSNTYPCGTSAFGEHVWRTGNKDGKWHARFVSGYTPGVTPLPWEYRTNYSQTWIMPTLPHQNPTQPHYYRETVQGAWRKEGCVTNFPTGTWRFKWKFPNPAGCP